ncbi:carboxypeptidase-like regulatory domain-containing protein [Streptomyces sp. M19]
MAHVEVGAGRPARVEAELRPAARVRGTVRGRDGRPLQDARVSLLDTAGDVVGVSLTDGTGAFGFADLTGERYTVVAAGYAPVSAPVTVGGSGGEPPEDVDFVLSHG